MEFRLFPNPTPGVCTPYVATAQGRRFARLAYEGRRRIVVEVAFNRDDVRVNGCPPERVIGSRRPHRRRLISWLSEQADVGSDFRAFVKSTIVVPTYAWTPEEAFVRTVIRQVIRASQAKRLYASFIQRFGIHDGLRYGFGPSQMLAYVSLSRLEELGLGFKARRIVSGLQAMNDGGLASLRTVTGIGDWSRQVLTVESKRDYCHYPIDDRSGQRIERECGISLSAARAESTELAADVYVYGASFVEDLGCH